IAGIGQGRSRCARDEGRDRGSESAVPSRLKRELANRAFLDNSKIRKAIVTFFQSSKFDYSSQSQTKLPRGKICVDSDGLIRKDQKSISTGMTTSIPCAKYSIPNPLPRKKDRMVFRERNWSAGQEVLRAGAGVAKALNSTVSIFTKLTSSQCS